MLLIFAAIVLLEHIFVFAITRNGPPYPRFLILGARTTQFTVMALLFWRQRRHTLLPTSAVERQLWSIWIGYMVACVVASLANMEINRLGQGHQRDALSMYPFWAVLSGLAFFVMGSNYWGWCYAVGVAFFGLALLMPLDLGWAALQFGLAWSVTLSVIGV